MAWTPTKQVIDTRAIGKNLLDFVKEKDAEALIWANQGQPLKEFQQLEESIANRLKPIYPSLAIVDEGNASDLTSDLLNSGFEITLEALIYGTEAATLPDTAKTYEHALKSMLANIGANLLNNTVQTIVAKLIEIETQYDEVVGANKQLSAFVQRFQTKATFRFYASAYQ